MGMLTFVIDGCMINVHALLNVITTPGESINAINEMEERIVAEFVDEHVKYKEKRRFLRHIHSA